MRVIGLVIKGEQKASRYYALPTANLELTDPLALDLGVYVGTATLSEGSAHPCIVCYTSRGDSEPKFEVHLFGWSGDLYDQELTVEVGQKVSNVVPFTGEEAMQNKVLADVVKAKQLLGIN